MRVAIFRQGPRGSDWLKHLALIAIAAITFYPFIFTLVSSFKDIDQFNHTFWLPAFPLHPENYLRAGSVMLPYIGNSVIASGASVIGVLLLASISAYVFARYPFPGRELLFGAIIVLLMVPGVLTLIPQFLLAKQLGLLNTRWALIAFYTASGQVMGIFLLRSFFATIPGELFEAARIDGANEIQLFTNIALPLSTAIISTVAILDILSTWNEYIWPLVTISSEDLKTHLLGLIHFQNMLSTDWGVIFAAYVIASLPLLLLFSVAMRAFVRGLTSGAIRA